MKVRYIVGLLIAIALTGAVVLLLTNGDGRGDREPTEVKVRKNALLRQKGASVQSVRLPQAKSKKSGLVMKSRGKRVDVPVRFRHPSDDIFRDESGKPYPEGDQRLMRRAQAAVDGDDPDGARALASEALKSSNAEVRKMAVEALGWFGEDTMAELTPFLSDPDPKVAERAHDDWMDALRAIEADAEKAGLIELALTGLKDRDMIEDVANELVGIDELSAVQVIANGLEEGGNANAKAALREVYETLTGDEWSGLDAAEAWLEENYEAEQ